MSDKKKMQLGMNPSTASHRLVKDVLWSFVVKTENDACVRCGELMSRDSFSIEHIEPWLDSEDPIGLYFDLENVGFSHLSCNIKHSRNGPKVRFSCGTHQSYARGCRCSSCIDGNSTYRSSTYCPDKRSARYKATGH